MVSVNELLMSILSTSDIYLDTLIIHTFYIDKCVTTFDGIVGPQKGAECIFPMKFQGKIYDGCVPVLANQECDWCSTKGKFLWSIGINIFPYYLI